MRALFILLLSTSAIFGDAFPTYRRSGLNGNLWQDAGVYGGIPSVTTVYTNLPLITLATDLEAVINNCPSNQVIMLTNQAYTLNNPSDGRLHITKNGVVIRGQTNANGEILTSISGVSVWIGAHGGSTPWPFDSLGTAINVTAGLTAGSTTVTLASAPNADITVGNVFMMDQTDDGTKVIAGTVSFVRRSGRNYNFMAMVTGISGNDVTFTPPLVGNYWDTAARTPQAFGWTTTVGNTYKMIGIENVQVTNSTSSEAIIGIGRAYNCWMKNIRTANHGAGDRATQMRSCVNCEIRDSVFANQDGAAANNAYACYLVGASYCAVDNNILTNLALGFPCVNAVGCSWSYNVAFGPSDYSPSTWNPEYFFPHGGHCFHNLYEGNWLFGPIVVDDIFLNNHSTIAATRNRLIGWLSGKTDNNKSWKLEVGNSGFHATNTFLGNVEGMEGYHTLYSDIYTIDSGVTGTIKTNNYNTVDDGVNSSETMSGDTMLDSYRYPSKPSWVPGQWPFYPVSSTSTNTLYYTNSPAGFRSYYGFWPAQLAAIPSKVAIRGIRLAPRLVDITQTNTVSADSLSTKILLGENGMHSIGFLKYPPVGNGVVSCLSWSNLNNVTPTALVPVNATGWGDPAVLLVGGHIVYADWAFATGVTIDEISHDGLTSITNFTIGNETNRWPTGVVTSNQGCALFSYKHQVTTDLVIDTAYRSPSGVWTNTTFSLTYAPIIPSVIMNVKQGTDGLIYLFIARDSSHKISLARFSEGPGGITLVDYDVAFLNDTDGDMSPHGEFPYMSSAVDYANNRILLSYTSFAFGDVRCGFAVSRPVITIVGTNKSKTLLGVSNLWVDRSYPASWVFVTDPGADLLQYYFNQNDCATKPWQMSQFISSSITDNAGTVTAPTTAIASQDRYFLFREPNNTVTIMKLR